MKKAILILIAVFIAGLCSIVYELLVSTAATYFLGDGVKQFSLIIGIYLCSMGVGAYFAKYFEKKSLLYFVKVEYLLGFVGGISVPLIYYLFTVVSPDLLQFYCLFIIFVIGTLTGMEIPLLTFASEQKNFKDALSDVLSLDYFGGLIATLIFPFVLLPFVGLFYSSLAFGIVNIGLGLFLNIKYQKEAKGSILIGASLLTFLVIGICFGSYFLKVWDQKIYKHPIVVNEQTSFQKIVMTKKQDDVRLFLNRVIQFSSADEYRYHEMLVHTPLFLHAEPKTVLILGGGENLASREALKHTSVERIDVVDIDEVMFDLAKNNNLLKSLNKNAALDKRVNLITDDAFSYLHQTANKYDVIIADLPDPSNESLARLYSRQFFLMAKSKLNKGGIFTTQSGEVNISNTVFSCINQTMKDVFGTVIPQHVYIPSFGDWGFNIALPIDYAPVDMDFNSISTAYLTNRQLDASFNFPKDISIANTKVNTLDNPVILKYFLEDWNKWKSDFQINTK